MDGAYSPQTYAIVMRMRGLYPRDLAGYEAHRLRKNGDLNHFDRDRSDPDRNLLIGDKDWARIGVRPSNWTSSSRGFDRLAGVVDLVLNRAEIARR